MQATISKHITFKHSLVELMILAVEGLNYVIGM